MTLWKVKALRRMDSPRGLRTFYIAALWEAWRMFWTTSLSKIQPLCPTDWRKALASYFPMNFVFVCLFVLTADILEASPGRIQPNHSWLTLQQPSFISSLTFLHLPYRSWEDKDCTAGLQHCEKAEREAHAKADLTKPLDGKRLPLLML